MPEGEASDFEEEEEEEEEDDEVEEEEAAEDLPVEEEDEQQQQQEAEGKTSGAAKDDGLGLRRSIRKRSSPARLKPTVTNMGTDSETIREIARAAGAKDGQVLAKALEGAMADGRTEATRRCSSSRRSGSRCGCSGWATRPSPWTLTTRRTCAST